MAEVSFRRSLFLFGYRFIERRTCRKQLFRRQSGPIKSGNDLRNRFRRILAGRILLRRADWDDRGLRGRRWLTSCDEQRGSSEKTENHGATEDSEPAPAVSSLRGIIDRYGGRTAVGDCRAAARAEVRCLRHRSTALRAIHFEYLGDAKCEHSRLWRQRRHAVFACFLPAVD